MRRFFYEIRNKIRFILGFGRKQRELDDEIDFHIEEAMEDLIRSGVSPREARIQANRSFGHRDSVLENCRDSWGTRRLQELKRDVAYAVRGLLKTPSFTCIALVTLALSIGVNTSMFSVLNALLFHTPAYAAPDSLIRIYRTSQSAQHGPHAVPNFIDLRARTKSFSHLALYADRRTIFAEPGQMAESLSGLAVTGDFFEVLGVKPALGRFIASQDDQIGSAKVVVLSHSLWEQRFEADPGIVGQSIRLDGEAVTIIGVMPERFEDPFIWDWVRIWRPFNFDSDTLANRNSNGYSMIGRLDNGVSIDQALVEMNTHCAALAQAYPDSNAGTGVNLKPFVLDAQDDTHRRLSYLSMSLAACVLLIACVNLANLLFARNALRSREIAIRGALGATRMRLIRQSLTESLALSFVGGAFGLLLAHWCNRFLGSHAFLGNRDSTLAVDWRIAGFAFAIASLAAVLSGILPALISSRNAASDVLKQGARGSTSSSHGRIQHILIVSEVALALVLLAGAGFFLRGLEQFHDRDNGWNAEDLLVARISLPGSKYPDNPEVIAFFEQLQERLAALPGVTSVSISSSMPFHSFNWNQRYIVEGEPIPKPGTEPMRRVNSVSASYFETTGITLLDGRSFAASDLEGPEKTIISENMARSLWPNESAIGKRIAHPTSPSDWQEIIGVARDVRFASNLDRDSGRFQSYRFHSRTPWSGNYIALRCAVPPSSLAESVLNVVSKIDPEMPVNNLGTALQKIKKDTAEYALIGWALAGFATLGLTLAAVGLYGMLSGYVAQRANEIGIRMALGAKRSQVIRFVVNQGLRLVTVGILIGLVGSWGVSRLIQSIIPSLPQPESHIAAGIALLLLLTAFGASWFPAKRAVTVDPMETLRAE